MRYIILLFVKEDGNKINLEENKLKILNEFLITNDDIENNERIKKKIDFTTNNSNYLGIWNFLN